MTKTFNDASLIKKIQAVQDKVAEMWLPDSNVMTEQ